MSRPLRIEYPGAMYHVMNRGNQRQDVFRKKVDCVTFMDKLEYFSDLFNIDVYCYVLMNNHFHLLLRTNEANLGRFMQSFLTSFTMILNRRNARSGHLFQGRYKAQLVESEEYMSKLSRYIHLNPLRIKKHKNLRIEDKRNILRNYTWSSFNAYIGQNPPEHFLEIYPVLELWGTDTIQKMKNYRIYVEEGLYKDVENPFDLAFRQQIIGSETFAEQITRKKILNRKVKDKKEERMLCIFQSSIHPNVIINAVAAHFRIDAEKVTQRKSTEKLSRQIAMYLCSLYCNSRISLTDIGKHFSVSLSGLTRSRDSVKDKIEIGNTELKEIISIIKKSIAEV